MKKILLSICLAALGYLTNAQGNLLVVHNSPDPAVATVDVWVEVPIVSVYIKAVEDISYQQAYFYTIAAALPGSLVVHVKASNSTVMGDPDLFTKTFATVPTGDNILVATGLVTTALIDSVTNPTAVPTNFDLVLKSTGVQFSSPNSTDFALSMHNGTVDAPAVVVQSFVTTIQLPARDTAFAGEYLDISNSTLVPASARRYHVIQAGNAQTSPYYRANGDVLRTLGGKAAFIVTSGFWDTTGTGTTNTFKVLAYVTTAATTAGVVNPVELPIEKLAGVTEIIHASADPLLKKIELYVNGIKQFLKLDYLQRFQSSSFIQNFHYDINVHANDSAASSLSINLLLNDTSTIGVIAGVANTAGFTPNPDGKNILVSAYTDKPFVTTSPTNTTVVNIFHAATDGPTLSGTVPSAGGVSIFSNISYGQFQKAAIAGNTAIPTTLGSVVVDLKLTNNTVFKSYIVPLAALDGLGITLVATGFVDSTANKNGRSFGLYLAIPTSPIGFLTPLRDTTLQTSINDPSTADLQFRMFPNPVSSELIVAFDVTEMGRVTVDILDMNGRVVKQVTNSVFDTKTVAIATDIRDLQSGMYYTRVISGINTSTYKFNIVR